MHLSRPIFQQYAFPSSPLFSADLQKKKVDLPIPVTLSKVVGQQEAFRQKEALAEWAKRPFQDQINSENLGLDVVSVQALQTMTPLEVLQTLKREAKWMHLFGKSLTAVSSVFIIPFLPFAEFALGPELKGLGLFSHPKNRPLRIKKWRFFNASRYLIEHIKMEFIHPKTRSLSFVSAENNPWLNAPARIDMWRAHKLLDLMAEKGLLETVYKPWPGKKGSLDQRLFLGYAISPSGLSLLGQAKE